MNRGLSLYLDLVRLLAALGVVLSHARTFLLPTMPYALGGHGSECVAVFFVLSGFVIRFVSVEKDEGEWRRYAVARLARIAPVALLSLAVTLVCTLLGARYGATVFQRHQVGSVGEEALDAVRAALFLNELWFTHSVFGTNEPYWSLGFEVPYYALFGLLLFLSGRPRILAVVGWALLFGPKVLAYLPLWLLGVAVYELLRRHSDRPGQPWLGGLLILTSVAAYYLVRKTLNTGQPLTFEPHTLVELATGAVYFTLVGLAFALNIVGADRLLRRIGSIPAALAGPVRWLAGGSFTVYLTHMPLMVLACELLPDLPRHTVLGLGALLIILAICTLLAELAERRKKAARRLIGGMFGV